MVVVGVVNGLFFSLSYFGIIVLGVLLWFVCFVYVIFIFRCSDYLKWLGLYILLMFSLWIVMMDYGNGFFKWICKMDYLYGLFKKREILKNRKMFF